CLALVDQAGGYGCAYGAGTHHGDLHRFPPFVCCGAGSTRGGVEARSVARVWKSCCSGHRKWFSVFLCGSGSKDPSFLWGAGHVVDACFSTTHQPVFVEFPEFISVAAPPLPLDVAAFVLETYCDAVFVEGPQFFA